MMDWKKCGRKRPRPILKKIPGGAEETHKISVKTVLSFDEVAKQTLCCT
jgi:hypothetical protein